jgi:hypothetical protein
VLQRATSASHAAQQRAGVARGAQAAELRGWHAQARGIGAAGARRQRAQERAHQVRVLVQTSRANVQTSRANGSRERVERALC